jgi:hypothetical protein
MADWAARRVLEALEADPQDAERLASALTLLRDVHPAVPPESFDPRPYIDSQEWVFARTMPENPHFYVHLSKTTDWRSHLVVLLWIRAHGEVERFKGRDYRYQTVDGWRLWAMGPNDSILNKRRAPAGAASVPLRLELGGDG